MKPDMDKAEKWLWAGNTCCILMIFLLPAISIPPFHALPAFLLMAVATLVCFGIHALYMPKD